MPSKQEQDDRRARAQAHPPAFAQVFGDLDPNLFTDEPPLEPSRSSSAAMHARRVQAGRQEAAHERAMAQLSRAAQEDADAEHLGQALARIREGKTVKPAVASAAMRALRRQGGMQLSSAELHALHRASGDAGWQDLR